METPRLSDEQRASIGSALAEMEKAVQTMLGSTQNLPGVDKRLMSIALTQIEIGFMAAQKAMR